MTNLKNGFKKENKIEPYPIRKEDNCVTNLYFEIKFPNSEPFNKSIRYVGRAKNNELNEISKRDYFMNGWISQECTVKLIKNNLLEFGL